MGVARGSGGPAGCLGPNAAHLVLIPGPRAGGDDPAGARAEWVRHLGRGRRARGLPDLCAEWAWFAVYGPPVPRAGDRWLLGRLARAAAAHTCAAPGVPPGGRRPGEVPPALRGIAAYLTRQRAREELLAAVTGAVPPAGDVVVVAHGLGAVVAVDLMTRLPREVRVTGLVTLGAPLGLEAVRRRLELGGAVLPRPVPAWLDVWSAADPLSMGAPARRAWHGQVTRTRELPATTGGAPDVFAYLGDPVVRATVGSLLSREFVPPADRSREPRGPIAGTLAGHRTSCPATVRSAAGRSHDSNGF